MALHFTSSSILTSDDGIGFNKEVALETAEAKLARKASEQAASKPLYMQLAEKKELEQQEYDANTKRMFGKPLHKHFFFKLLYVWYQRRLEPWMKKMLGLLYSIISYLSLDKFIFTQLLRRARQCQSKGHASPSS